MENPNDPEEEAPAPHDQNHNENLEDSRLDDVDSLRHSEESFEFTVNETIALRKKLDHEFMQESANRPPAPSFPKGASAYMKSTEEHEDGAFLEVLHQSKNLPVYLRLRPCYSKNKRDEYSTIEVTSETTIKTSAPKESNAGKINRQFAKYEFSRVFGAECNQKDFYENTALPLVCSVAREQSALLFCYGITNAGKTHTVLGNLKDPEEWGIVPRAIHDLLRMQQKEIHISYFELYNEQVYDLLSQGNGCFKQETLRVRERNGEAVIQELTKIHVQSIEHGIEMTRVAKLRRHTATNNLNRDSSRSHCICQILVGDATLWLVDLAGSERVKRTDANSARRKEAAHINQSLMTLMQCLKGMRENSQIVPYRNSKLTIIFMKHFLGPFAQNTGMIVNANPAASDYDETQHVLGYAAASKSVEMKPLDQKRSTTSEYGYDGRRIVENKQSKIAAFVSNLSPKFMKRKDPPPSEVDQDQVAKKRKSVSEQQQTKSGQDDMMALQEEIRVLKATNEELLTRNEELLLKNEEIESQVREEVANEMADQIKTMEERYEDMLSRMKPDEAKSTRKLEELHKLREKNSLLEETLEDMRTQVQDCEEEMKRMRDDFERDLANVKQAHHYELQTKDAVIDDLHSRIAELESRDSVETDPESSSDSSSDIGDRRLTRLQRQSESTSSSKASSPESNRKPRIPLRSLSSNQKNSPTSSNGSSCGSAELVFPRKAPKKDPSTGTYQRPRGRPPSGVEAWDENRGAWRVSNA